MLSPNSIHPSSSRHRLSHGTDIFSHRSGFRRRPRRGLWCIYYCRECQEYKLWGLTARERWWSPYRWDPMLASRHFNSCCWCTVAPLHPHLWIPTPYAHCPGTYIVITYIHSHTHSHTRTGFALLSSFLRHLFHHLHMILLFLFLYHSWVPISSHYKHKLLRWHTYIHTHTLIIFTSLLHIGTHYLHIYLLFLLFRYS